MPDRRPLAPAVTRLRRTLVVRARWLDGWWTPITLVGLGALAVVAVFRMERSSADFDPQFMRVVVERTMRFGGGYYDNAIHNKGPLEPVVYEIAGRLGGRDGWWFVIAVMTLAATLCIGATAAVVAERAGAGRPVAVAAGAAVVAHLTLSEADYAGVLYARNMVVTLLSVALTVTVVGRCWATERRRRWAVVAIGAATGLAVQTLFTACFTAAPVLLHAMWVRRRERVGGRPVWWMLPAASAAAFVSAPVYYALADAVGLRSFPAFVDGWWRYARFMSAATGRGPAGQVTLAWDRATEYYADRPVVAVALAVWLVAAALRWRRAGPAERGVDVLLLAWFLGAWVELAVSQRYSSHYFSVLAVPSLLMAAQLAGWATARWRRAVESHRWSVALALVAALATIQAGGTAPVGEGIERAATIHSPGELGRRADAGRGGRVLFERAVLSVFSEPDDALLAWTSYPWIYLDRQRVSATRYIWKSFLLGEIYLGGRSDEYVLPGTWEQWRADLVEANPVAYLVESANPVEAGTPFEREVAARFRTVHTEPEATLALRGDLAAWLLAPPTSSTAGHAMPGGRLAEAGCTRIDGVLQAGETRFTLGGATAAPATIVVTLDSAGAGSVESNRHGVAGHRVELPPASGFTAFTLVSGARATLLVVGAEVVGAVERGSTTVDVAGGGAADVLAGAYAESSPHAVTGC